MLRWLDEDTWVSVLHGRSVLPRGAHERSLCRVDRPVYGLDDAPAAWHAELVGHLHRTGWQQLETDPETKELLEVLFSDETEIPHHSSGLDSDVYQKSVMSAGEVSTELGFEVDDGNVYYMAHE